MEAQNQVINQLFTLATKAHQDSKYKEAEKIYREILKKVPNHSDSLHLLGILCSQKGDFKESINYLKRALATNPKNPIFYNNLGEALRRKGELNEAIFNYRQAIIFAPTFPDAHYNLAIALKDTGDIDASINHYQQAIKLRPNHAKAHYNLGNIMLELGKYKTAMNLFQQALLINKNYPEAYNNLGITLKEWDRVEEAIVHFEESVKLNPNFIEGYRNLGSAFEKQGKIDLAKKCYEKIINIDSNNQLLKLQIETMSEIIHQSTESIDEYQKNLINTLDKYINTDLKIDLKTICNSGFSPLSNLLYEGRNEKEIKVKYAKIFQKYFNYDFEHKPNEKPHIGFVVTNGHEGVFIKCMRGLLNNLKDEKFKFSIVCSLPNGEKILRPVITNPNINFISIPQRFDMAIDTLRKENFDLLNYWEVGTDVTNYLLPFCKLSRFQCSNFGWPTTSGIEDIDFFLSSENLETEKSDNYYTEKLIRFKHLPIFYYKPPVPKVIKPRSEFGLSDNKHIYLCNQNLKKVHPDMDKLFIGILEKDTKGILVLIEDKQQNINELLKNRLQKTLGKLYERVIFLERMSETEYLNLLKISDVILDTLYYGGGANTTYDAFATGTPIVTLPTELHRSRYAYASYHQIGITDCIAKTEDEYINLSVRLANDLEYRDDISSRIIKQSDSIFEDELVIKEFIEFINYIFL